MGFVTNGGRENGTVKRTGEENTQIKCLSNGFLLRSYNDSRQPCAIICIYLSDDPCVARATYRYRTRLVRLQQQSYLSQLLIFLLDDFSPG